MLTRERFLDLLEKYTLNVISPEERSELFNAVSSGQYDHLITTHLDQRLALEDLDKVDLSPHRAAELMHKILASEKQNEVLLPRQHRKNILIRWTAIAASIALLAVLGFVLYTKQLKDKSPTANLASNSISKHNNTTSVMKLVTDDGSVVSLQPGSTLHYPLHFNSSKREVILEGEAFFEVTRDINRPFFVYNRDIVTHVLGTSFNVKANKDNQQVEVAVRSGKVEVYQADNDRQNTRKPGGNGVVLLPNQKVVYNEKAKQFIPSVVDQPLPVINNSNTSVVATPRTVFEETSLKEVLPTLEKTYGIEIITENEHLYNCLFTGDISQQDLFTRLEILCKAVGATYEIMGTRILIKGKGCEG